jgi:toxin-antitoxin system PIN domain toxin
VISIDTNLLLYSLNRDCPEHGTARAFVESCVERNDIAIAELVLVELYVLLRHPAVVRKPLEAEAAASLCQALRHNPHWARVDTAAVMDKVWTAAARPGVARRYVFDARLAHTLLANGVKQLATHNPRAFEGFGFERVFDPLQAALPSTKKVRGRARAR